MRGVVFLGDRELALKDFPDPTPGLSEVVVAMKASGMCGSDLKHYRAVGSDPRRHVIAGHEPCGVVAAVGAGVSRTLRRLVRGSWFTTTRVVAAASIAALVGRSSVETA